MTDNTALRPLGSMVAPDSPYNQEPDVISEISQSPTGNTTLRIGKMEPRPTRAEAPWHSVQTGYIVLDPEERERLIAALIAQR